MTARHALMKFDLDAPQGIRAYYEEHGYVIVRGIIPRTDIDAFLVQLPRIGKHPRFVYFSQSIHRSMPPTMNEHGHIRESMLNPSRLGFFPEWTRAIKRCIYHAAVSRALHAIDGEARHVAWQDMFFDLSTGTIEHQDTWYLDTDPPGHLVAAWFALEDIDERAGPFFVMPGSHRAEPLDRATYPDHEAFRRATLEFIRRGGFQAKPVALDKGDVLFWHPFTVHGAFDNQDPAFSRKSFTCHYLPAGAKRMFKRATRTEPTGNPAIDRVARGPDVLMNAAVWARYAVDAFRQGKARMDMRRSSYEPR